MSILRPASPMSSASGETAGGGEPDHQRLRGSTRGGQMIPTCWYPLSRRIKPCSDARRICWRLMLHSTPPRTRPPRRREASNASAFPIVRPKASNANASRKSAASATARMAHRLRGTHQRRKTPTWPTPLPLQGLCRHAPLGRPRRHRRQPRQHRARHRKADSPLSHHDHRQAR